MAFSIRKLFSNLFLSVVLDDECYHIYGRVFKNDKVIKTIEAKFDDQDPQERTQKLKEYIARQEKTANDSYIGLLFNEPNQGALPVCKADEYQKYGISPEGLSIMNVDDKFSIYADTSALAKAKNSLSQVDVIYSPIALLYHEVISQTPPSGTCLYLYSHANTIALAIFNGYELLFATFFKINETESTDIAETLKSEDITDISNLIAAEEDEAKNLDDFQSIDDFLKSDGDGFADIDYDINMPNSSNVAASVAIFGRDMSIFSYITTAIREFYHNPNYKGNFIDKIIIFDSARVSATFLQYLHSELLIQAEVRPVATAQLINELMQKEIVL